MTIATEQNLVVPHDRARAGGLEAGCMRLEARHYVMQGGEVMLFRFDL